MPLLPAGDGVGLHGRAGVPEAGPADHDGGADRLQLRSAGSGKLVHVHFCAACGTKLFLTFERFAETCGVYAGTFDDPDWFDIRPDNAKHLFIKVARHDTILPSDVPCFEAHALTNAGAPLEHVVVDEPHPVGQVRGAAS